MWIRAREGEAHTARPGAARQTSFAASNLEARMFNVGHGEAILVIFPGGHTWLIDGGNTNNLTANENFAGLLLDYLAGRELTLEACVPTHPHIDHAGALPTILSSRSSVLASELTVYRAAPDWDLNRVWLNRYHQAIDDLGSKVDEIVLQHSHREVTIADGATAHLFAGSGDGPYTSVFMQVRFGSARLLFTGDAHCAYELQLLEAFGATDFRADLLKVTHHGSSSGTARRTLDAIMPALAIASTGDDEGHRLEQDTLDRILGPAGMRCVFETHVDGDIVVRTDGEPYLDGTLYQVEFETPGEFANQLHANVVTADQIHRGRSDDRDCQ